MAARKRMRALLATPRNDPAAWGPADKARPRVDPDPLVMLAKAYRNDEATGLSPDLERAAMEVWRIFVYLTSGSRLKAAALDRSPRGERAPPSDGLVEAYLGNYLPWAREMSARYKQTGIPFMEVVIDLAVERHSPNRIDRSRNWRNGRAIVLIREALQRYCEIAGWVRR